MIDDLVARADAATSLISELATALKQERAHNVELAATLSRVRGVAADGGESLRLFVSGRLCERDKLIIQRTHLIEALAAAEAMHDALVNLGKDQEKLTLACELWVERRKEIYAVDSEEIAQRQRRGDG